MVKRKETKQTCGPYIPCIYVWVKERERKEREKETAAIT